MDTNNSLHFTGNPDGSIRYQNVNYNHFFGRQPYPNQEHNRSRRSRSPRPHQRPYPRSYPQSYPRYYRSYYQSHDHIDDILYYRSYYDAINYLNSIYIPWRITYIDNMALFVTQDYRPNRVNLQLRTNKYPPFNNEFGTQEDALDYVNQYPESTIIVGITFG